VDAWNSWYDGFGNTAEGFAAESARVTEIARRVGRNPAEIERSACAFVVLDRSVDERPIPTDFPAVEGAPEAVAAHLRELAEAGADEVILVANPITERSIRDLGNALVLLDRD
jgi:alkanesulfonate monooxygenase SsuD/methylene tetrahydromethanopterin reductase-like flavin-dependent oxidoreductase (luciferase family)